MVTINLKAQSPNYMAKDNLIFVDGAYLQYLKTKTNILSPLKSLIFIFSIFHVCLQLFSLFVIYYFNTVVVFVVIIYKYSLQMKSKYRIKTENKFWLP